VLEAVWERKDGYNRPLAGMVSWRVKREDMKSHD